MASEAHKDGEIIFTVEHLAEGGFVAQAVGASIFTQAESIEHLRTAVREAVECHFGEEAAPKRIRLRITREEVLET